MTVLPCIGHVRYSDLLPERKTSPCLERGKLEQADEKIIRATFTVLRALVN